MRVELKPGETVIVCFAESDGEIKVAFGKSAIVVTADLPDTTGREGVIYCEEFGQDINTDKVAKAI